MSRFEHPFGAILVEDQTGVCTMCFRDDVLAAYNRPLITAEVSTDTIKHIDELIDALEETKEEMEKIQGVDT